jgi:type IV secretion system protein VirB2
LTAAAARLRSVSGYRDSNNIAKGVAMEERIRVPKGAAADRNGGEFPSKIAMLLLALPGAAIAQSSPFMTGATALQNNILAWLTPVAIILVMVLGAMAMAARMSWGWCIGAILGIAMAFGAPQIVQWVRGMFGV